jgi:hypothetical protein
MIIRDHDDDIDARSQCRQVYIQYHAGFKPLSTAKRKKEKKNYGGSREEETLLPAPCFSFTPTRGRSGHMEFMGLFGRGEAGTLLAGVDYGGASLASLAYDVQERVVRPIASPHGPLRHGQGAPPRQRPYRSCFEVLALDDNKYASRCWEWRSLKLAPFRVRVQQEARPVVRAVVGGSAVWISAPGAGTPTPTTRRPARGARPPTGSCRSGAAPTSTRSTARGSASLRAR